MFTRNRSKRSLLIKSTPDIRSDHSGKIGKRKHYLTHEFEVLFNKINNVREWTKTLIKDSMAIVSLETDMNIKGYLEDSEKKHLGRTKHEILGANMINAAKGSGIKGGPYEQALIKVGECERRLGTFGRDYVVDVCSSFIRPLKYFLDVELNKLVEEKEMLTSRKIDFDYHVKQVNSGKTDKNVLHKLKMAEMALEFQYIHAKEVLQDIEASECQVGHLSDLVNVQSLYHQKCLAELEKLKTDLKKMSSNTESEKKSSKTMGVSRKGSNLTHKRSAVERDDSDGKPPRVSSTLNDDLKMPAKKLDSCKELPQRLSEDRFQKSDKNSDEVDAYSVKRTERPHPGVRSTTDKQSKSRYPESSAKEFQKDASTRKPPTEPKLPPEGNNYENISKQDCINEPPGKECSNKKTKYTEPHSSHCRPRCKPMCQNHAEDKAQETSTPDGLSTDDSSASKETHVIPIPVRSNYRRDVGKIYFTPRQNLE